MSEMRIVGFLTIKNGKCDERTTKFEDINIITLKRRPFNAVFIS